MSKHHPGFNNHPSVAKGEGHSKPTKGHTGVDKGMHPGGMKPPSPQPGMIKSAPFPGGKMPKGGAC